ncbi:MAG: hypothetical protein K2Q14_07715 [Gammaproteobacteria bacterium]|nr:hypothetical protein [Gammaproteobacteria bacterium]
MIIDKPLTLDLYSDKLYNAIQNKDPQLKETFETYVKTYHDDLDATRHVLAARNNQTFIPAIHDFMTDEFFENISDYLDLILMNKDLDEKIKNFLLKAAYLHQPALYSAIQSHSLFVISVYMQKIIRSTLSQASKLELLQATTYSIPGWPDAFFDLFTNEHTVQILLYAEEVLDADYEHLSNAVKEALLSAKCNNMTVLDSGIKQGLYTLVLLVAELILTASKLGLQEKLNLVQALDNIPVSKLNDEEKLLWDSVCQLRAQCQEQMQNLHTNSSTLPAESNMIEDEFGVLRDTVLLRIMYYAALFDFEEEIQSNSAFFKSFSDVFFINGKKLALNEFRNQYIQNIQNDDGESELTLFKSAFRSFLDKESVDNDTNKIVTQAIVDIEYIENNFSTEKSYNDFYHLFFFLNKLVTLEIDMPSNPPELSELKDIIFNYYYCQSTQNYTQDLKYLKKILDNKKNINLLNSEKLKSELSALLKDVLNVCFRFKKYNNNNSPSHDLIKQFFWVISKLSVVENENNIFCVPNSECRDKALNLVSTHFISPLLSKIPQIKQNRAILKKRKSELNDGSDFKRQKINNNLNQNKVSINFETLIINLFQESFESLSHFQNFYDTYEWILTEDPDNCMAFKVIQVDINASLIAISLEITRAMKIAEVNNVNQFIEFAAEITSIRYSILRLLAQEELTSHDYDFFCDFMKNHIKPCIDSYLRLQKELFSRLDANAVGEEILNNNIHSDHVLQEKNGITLSEFSQNENSTSFLDAMLNYLKSDTYVFATLRDLICDNFFVFPENDGEHESHEDFISVKDEIFDKMRAISMGFNDWINGAVNNSKNISPNLSVEISSFNEKINSLSKPESGDIYSNCNDLFHNFFRMFFDKYKESIEQNEDDNEMKGVEETSAETTLNIKPISHEKSPKLQVDLNSNFFGSPKYSINENAWNQNDEITDFIDFGSESDAGNFSELDMG